MFKLSSNSVLASEVAEFLGVELHGDDIAVYGPVLLDNISDNSFVHCDDAARLPLEDIAARQEVLVLCNRDLGPGAPCSYVVAENPMLAFIRVTNHFFMKPIVPQVHDTAIVERTSVLGENVSVYPGCYVGADARIGDGTVIMHNAVIADNVRIGRNCVVKANSTVGSEKFDFIYADDQWEQLPQIGPVVIGNNVWIGAGTAIEKGSLSETVIADGVRIDDLVQIGSSCRIGEDAIIAAGSILCRDVRVGRKSWIAPNASVLENVKIGDQAVVGLGSVVIGDVGDGQTVAGNPAHVIEPKSR